MGSVPELRLIVSVGDGNRSLGVCLSLNIGGQGHIRQPALLPEKQVKVKYQDNGTVRKDSKEPLNWGSFNRLQRLKLQEHTFGDSSFITLQQIVCNSIWLKTMHCFQHKNKVSDCRGYKLQYDMKILLWYTHVGIVWMCWTCWRSVSHTCEL